MASKKKSSRSSRSQTPVVDNSSRGSRIDADMDVSERQKMMQELNPDDLDTPDAYDLQENDITREEKMRINDVDVGRGPGNPTSLRSFVEGPQDLMSPGIETVDDVTKPSK